jgi:DNA-binding transcriptional LysR family regulator
VLIVFPEHPFADRAWVSFLELTAEPLIFREDTSGTQLSVAASLGRAGFDIGRCRPALVLGTTEAVVSAVEAGSGIAFVSNLAIRKSVALGLVKAVAVEGVNLKREFWCVYHQERVTSRLLEEFLSFIKERAI